MREKRYFIEDNSVHEKYVQRGQASETSISIPEWTHTGNSHYFVGASSDTIIKWPIKKVCRQILHEIKFS